MIDRAHDPGAAHTVPEYREHRPTGDLADRVEAFWTLRGRVPSGFYWPQAVAPDGCMDILFDLGEGAARVIGPMTTPVEFSLRGPVELFGIRFRPGGLSPLLRGAAFELLDDTVEPELSLGQSHFIEPLLEGLLASHATLAPEAVSGVVRAWFDAHDPADEVVLRAARRLREGPGTQTIGDLADGAGVSRRSLERRFRRHVGVSPKFAARVERFRRAAACIDEAPEGSLSSIAIRNGYADQAHLTREFSELAGLSPARWRRARAGVAFVQDTVGQTR